MCILVHFRVIPNPIVTFVIILHLVWNIVIYIMLTIFKTLSNVPHSPEWHDASLSVNGLFIGVQYTSELLICPKKAHSVSCRIAAFSGVTFSTEFVSLTHNRLDHRSWSHLKFCYVVLLSQTIENAL